MKKFGVIVTGLFLIIFLFILIVNRNDRKYQEKLIVDIKENLLIDDIKYINRYDGYFIVKDSNYLYLIDENYKIISELDNVLLFKNINNYDIIYKNEIFMYYNEDYKDGVIIYEYYDINDYHLIDEVMVGGN